MRESQLLAHIYAAGAHVPIPPGDDMGMITVGDHALLAAVDQVVGGRHVSLESATMQEVGRKAICRSLSDVAAMGARPLGLLAAATLPPDLGEDHATELFDAMRATAEAYACPLFGGDIAISGGGPLVCSITVLAEPGPAGPIRRTGARAGDTVYVTGRLGGSLEPDGRGRHLSFEPRIAEALELAGQLRDRLHAMIDLSDGLARDAGHLATQSGVQIELDAASLPCHAGCSWRQALGDGEDYELCFTADGSVPADLRGVPVTAVGRVRPRGEPPLVVMEAGRPVEVGALGWEHRT